MIPPMMHFETATPTRCKSYATEGALAADVDAVADSVTAKDPARRIRIGVGGTVDFVFPDGAEGSVTYATGDVDDIAIKTVKATSTAQQITLYWWDWVK